mgnify:CR=1 FL=1|jgi:hypothetical protein
MPLELLTNFSKSAFRLESLPEYRIESEAVALSEFLKKGEADMSNEKDLLKRCELIKEKKSLGATIDRARIICTPATDYTRFEMTCSYPHSVKAGETIRLLSEDDFDIACDEEELDEVFNRWGALDFWLLDDKQLYILDYDDDGTYLGANESADEEDIKDAMRIRDAVMSINHFVEV